jgi:hypothetical protein
MLPRRTAYESWATAASSIAGLSTETARAWSPSRSAPNPRTNVWTMVAFSSSAGGITSAATADASKSSASFPAVDAAESA